MGEPLRPRFPRCRAADALALLGYALSLDPESPPDAPSLAIHDAGRHNLPADDESGHTRTA